MKNQKGFIQASLLIVIIGLVTLGGVYLGVKKYKSYLIKPTDNEKQILTSDQQKPESVQINKNIETISTSSENKTQVNTKSTPVPLISNVTLDIKPEASYKDLHCPRIILLEDSLGNKGSYENQINATFKKGTIDKLTLKITAIDPQGKTVYYKHRWGDLSQLRPEDSKWTTNNTFSIDVTNANLGSSPENISISNQDGYPCNGSVGDEENDIGVFFTYNVTP